MDIPNETQLLNKPSKIKTSQFMVTINPNISCKKVGDDLMKERLKETIQCVYSNQSLQHLVKFRDYRHSFTSKYIKGIKMEYALEKGKKCGFVHSHILLKIEHVSNIQLKFREMKEKVRQCLDFESLGLNPERKFYFNVRIVKDNNASVRYYMEKEAREEQSPYLKNEVEKKEGNIEFV